MSHALMKSALVALADGEALPDVEGVFSFLLSGEADPIQVAAFLTALHLRGESIEQIVAAARVLRKNMRRVELPPAVLEGAIDVSGTGGDRQGSLNISTAVTLVVAASGVVVAKHGNRAQSSKSGSADLLEALGVQLEGDPARAIAHIGCGFMFAQHHHPMMRAVGDVRRKLGFRTIFNLVGPLCNPASVKRQLLGVFDEKWLVPLAEALSSLGSTRAWVLCGKDGMDEITLTDKTMVASLKNGALETFELDPRAFGFSFVAPEALRGGSVEENKKAFFALLASERGAYRDIVLLNSAAALIVADKAATIEQGLEIATEALDRNASALLQKWIEVSRG